MPQTNQIVPRYFHPHVMTVINDNTIYEDAINVVNDDNSSKFISVFTSDKGIDNKLIKFTSTTDFVNTFGKSNYKKHGQPLMMPIALLNTGYATVNAMRIMPDNSFPANSVLYLYYKQNDEDPDNKKFQIKFAIRNIDSSSFAAGTDTGYDNFMKVAETFVEKTTMEVDDNYERSSTDKSTSVDDEDLIAGNWVRVPLCIISMAGRGSYGNNYRWRIARNKYYEKDYGIKIFNFELLNTENNTINVEQTFSGSIVTSPRYNTLTLIDDIVDNQDLGKSYIRIHTFEDNVELVYNAYKNFAGKDDSGVYSDENLPVGFPTIDEFDPFFARVIVDDDYLPLLDILEEAEGQSQITVDRIAGMIMASGSDGDFDRNATYTDPITGEVIDTDEYVDGKIKETYIRAFTNDSTYGKILDNSILSTKRVPCNAIFDANYDFDVKLAISDMILNKRQDCVFYIDCGLTDGDVDTVVSQMEPLSVSRNNSINWNWYYTKDPVTKKKIAVTITYFLAQTLPRHLSVTGSHIPFVKAPTQLSGHIKNQVYPVLSDADTETKEILYNNRINYYEILAENVYQRRTQSTAIKYNSDLLEENNVHTLCEMRKIIEKDCFDALYDFTSVEARANFTEYEKAKFANWIGVKVQSFDINFSVNEWEAERSIVHCYVAVQFRNLMKRVIIEIDINKRDFLA